MTSAAETKRPWSLILIVLYKGLWGMAEFVFGLVIAGGGLLLRAVDQTAFIRQLFAEELMEDPQDRFVHLLLGAGTPVNVRRAIDLGALLVLLGLLKLVLALGIWFRSWLVRNVSVALFTGTAVVGGYELLMHFSLLKFVAMVIDAFILYYLWRVLPKYLPKRSPR